MTCPRENELLDALARNFLGSELEEHVASCSACGELRLVATALLDERSEAHAEANVPASGTMWWRMQIRKRSEIQQTARRSLLVGQTVTLIVAIVLVWTFLGTQVTSAVTTLAASLRMSTPLLIAIATSLLLAPIAGWAALRQK